MSTRTDTRARRIGLALGLLLALAAVLSWRIPGGGEGLGADVSFVAAPPGELTTEPVEPFLSAQGLKPGEAAAGRLRLRNITGAPVAVRLRARPSSRELDRALMLELRTGDLVLRRRLASLRAWTRLLTLTTAETRTVAARAWLPAGGAPGAAVSVTVELEARGG